MRYAKSFRNCGILLATLFLVSWVPSSVFGAVVTSTTSQPLTVFLGTVKSVSQPKPTGQMGFDLGSNTFRYTQSGVQFFRSGGNMTMGLANLLSPTTSKNTSLIQYSFSSISLNVLYQIKNDTTNQYNRDIVISGTAVGTQTLSIVLSNPNSLTVHECNVNNNAPVSCAGTKNQVCYGSMCLNFADMPGFTFNNQTNSITGTVTGSFLFDPLAIDGTGDYASGNPASLTTTSSPDFIGLRITTTSENNKNCGSTGMTVTGGSLTWNCRSIISFTGSGAYEVAYFYAIASGTLTGASITVNGVTPSYGSVFGVSGANTGSPFDPSASACNGSGSYPCQNSDSTGSLTTPSIVLSTSNAMDMIILFNDAVGGTYSTPTGYTDIISSKHYDGNYKVLSATITTQTQSYTATESDWVIIADAIQATKNVVNQGIKITTLTAGAPSGTITITGCAPGNSTFTANGNVKHYSLTPSCTVTLTTSGTSGNTRYEWNVSPKPTISTTLTFNTCAGTCSEYDNSTYYQLQNTYQVTPVGPTVWDTAYAISASGTFLGVASHAQSVGTTSSGGGSINGALWFDYNLQVALPSAIGSFTPFPASSNLFTQITGGNTDNTNYAIVSSGGGGVNLDWLVLLPVIVLMLLVALRRRR